MIAPGLPTGNVTPSGTSEGASAAKSVTERLMSGGSTRMPSARHSAMYTAAFSRLLFTLVSRHARYSTGWCAFRYAVW